MYKLERAMQRININKDISRDINIDDLSIKSRTQTTSYRKLKLP